jgi:hypothetical protein
MKAGGGKLLDQLGKQRNNINRRKRKLGTK